MKRTIEKLSHQRKEKQAKFSDELEKIKKKSQELSRPENILRLQHLSSRLTEIIESGQKVKIFKKDSSEEPSQSFRKS
jgi:hypothetical protein